MSKQAYANAIVIALGSNHDAKVAFTCAIKSLQELGRVVLSHSEFVDKISLGVVREFIIMLVLILY